MTKLEAGGKLVTLYGAVSSAEPCPVVFLNTVMDEGEKVYTACRKLGAPPFVLATISRVNWSDDMTPWPTEALAKWESRCGGMADLYLEKLEGEIVPAVCEALPFTPSGLYLAGYSLGGLFALYALWKTTLFTRVASASGSLWYPDFAEYCLTEAPAGVPERVYLSLGSKETKSRGRTACLLGNTTAVGDRLRDLGAEVVFEENPGGHTHEADRRMAKGIIALLK